MHLTKSYQEDYGVGFALVTYAYDVLNSDGTDADTAAIVARYPALAAGIASGFETAQADLIDFIQEDERASRAYAEQRIIEAGAKEERRRNMIPRCPAVFPGPEHLSCGLPGGHEDEHWTGIDRDGSVLPDVLTWTDESAALVAVSAAADD